MTKVFEIKTSKILKERERAVQAAPPGLPVLPGFYSPLFAVTWSTWFGSLVRILPCLVYPVWFRGQKFGISAKMNVDLEPVTHRLSIANCSE